MTSGEDVAASDGGNSLVDILRMEVAHFRDAVSALHEYVADIMEDKLESLLCDVLLLRSGHQLQSTQESHAGDCTEDVDEYFFVTTTDVATQTAVLQPDCQREPGQPPNVASNGGVTAESVASQATPVQTCPILQRGASLSTTEEASIQSFPEIERFPFPAAVGEASAVDQVYTCSWVQCRLTVCWWMLSRHLFHQSCTTRSRVRGADGQTLSMTKRAATPSMAMSR